MSLKYQPYPAYKKAYLGWLNEIPSHWEVKRLKHLGEAIIGLTYAPSDVVDSESGGTLVLRSSNIQNRSLAFVDNVYVSKNIPQKLRTQNGDILVCARNGSRALIGKNVLLDQSVEGVTFGAFMSIYRSPYNRYLSNVFNSALFEYQSSTYLSATINQLTTSNLNSFEIPFPPKHERVQIANFLDRETAKIDALIEKQQRLIALLKEKRQAVISHAVTKGLDPSAPMKDSGVEWLGKVPAHWGIVPLKYLCRFSGGGTPPKDNLAYWTDGHIPWVSPKDMKCFNLNGTKDYVTTAAVNESSTNLVEKGSLLIVVRSGILQRTIPIAINTIPVTMNQDMKALRLDSQMKPLYAANIILGNEARLLLEWSKEGATVESLEHEYLANTLFPVPPQSEQNEINNAIAIQVSKFDEMEKLAVSGIALLKERRTALISAAVTGKIDVRGHASAADYDLSLGA